MHSIPPLDGMVCMRTWGAPHPPRHLQNSRHLSKLLRLCHSASGAMPQSDDDGDDATHPSHHLNTHHPKLHPLFNAPLMPPHAPHPMPALLPAAPHVPTLCLGDPLSSHVPSRGNTTRCGGCFLACPTHCLGVFSYAVSSHAIFPHAVSSHAIFSHAIFSHAVSSHAVLPRGIM